jgi:alpha(1,3/1,4) fucosyltransferase
VEFLEHPITMGKDICIKYVDFYQGFNYKEHFIYKWLLANGYNVTYASHNQPDYLVFGVFGDENLQYNDSVKIFCTGECQTPDFNLCDYAIGFDYLDFGKRYLRYPLYFLYSNAYERMLTKHELSNEEINRKTDFCAFVCSNSRAAEQRVAFFQALNAKRHVDSGGKMLNNVGGPVVDKLAFQSTHRFSMAFENTCYPGYSTEKIVESFASSTIPIYFGDPLITKDFNPKAFINCADYPSFDEVIQRVLEIDDNPELYKQYLREPALNNMHLKEEANKALHAFLLNIFEQPKESAKCYSRNYWGVRLVQERLRQQRAYQRSMYYRLRAFFMKHIYPKARKNIILWKITQHLMPNIK